MRALAEHGVYRSSDIARSRDMIKQYSEHDKSLHFIIVLHRHATHCYQQECTVHIYKAVLQVITDF